MHRYSRRDDRKRFTITQNCSQGSGYGIPMLCKIVNQGIEILEEPEQNSSTLKPQSKLALKKTYL